MVATLRSALLRQAFFFRASWNDPLTLKLITRSTEPPRPLSTRSPTHDRDFTCTIYRDGCICSNYGSIPILPVLHCSCRRRNTGEQYWIKHPDSNGEGHRSLHSSEVFLLRILHCERSSGQYLFDALIDAGDEFGKEVDGFVDPGNRGD